MELLEEKLTTVQQELAELKATGNSDESIKKRVEFLERAERLDTLIIRGINYDITKLPEENIITEIYKATGYRLYWDDIKFVTRFTSAKKAPQQHTKLSFTVQISKMPS